MYRCASPQRLALSRSKRTSALVAAAEALAPAWGLMLRVWAQSGMRSGELRGLQHQDFDPRTGRVSIQRTRTLGVTGPAKTARSVREAALTHPTCEATAAWQPGTTPKSRVVLARLSQLVPLDPAAPLLYVAQQSGHSARIMLSAYARWQEQGAKVAAQSSATLTQPAPMAAPLTPRDSASGAGYGILPT